MQGKFIEQALFAHVVGSGARFIGVGFVATAGNGPARVLESIGFQPAEGGFRVYVAPGVLATDLVTVETTWDAALSAG